MKLSENKSIDESSHILKFTIKEQKPEKEEKK